MRFAWSRQLFTRVKMFFTEFWELKANSNPAVEAFISYFRNEWLGEQWNWFRGAAPGTVMHNQTIEKEQHLFKQIMSHRLFKKMHLLQFLNNAIEYVETMSRRRQDNTSHIEEPIKFATIPEYNRKVT